MMKLHFYGMCGLVLIFRLYSTSASLLSNESDQTLSKNQFIKEDNDLRTPINDSKITKLKSQGDKLNLNVQDIVLNTTELVLETARPRLGITFKLKDKRKNVVLKAIKQILEEKSRKRKAYDKNMKEDKVNQRDIDFIAATDLVKIVLAKSRTKRSARSQEETNLYDRNITVSNMAPREINDKISKVNNAASADITLTNTSKRFAKPDTIKRRIDKTNKSTSNSVKIALDKSRLKRYAKPEDAKTDKYKLSAPKKLLALINIRSKDFFEPENEKIILFSEPESENTVTDEIDKASTDLEKAKTRSKRYIKPKINIKIDEMNNGRDIVLDALKPLIENEKIRRRFEMADPPNSKYSKRQQFLWDRLRIKAAEELLIHPKALPQRVTERVYDTLKWDMELATQEPTMEPGLFNEFKRRIQKQFYLAERESGRSRDLISTLKPLIYE